MTFRPNPKQALLLWRMLTADTFDERCPLQSKAKPEITAGERTELVRAGLLELDPQKRGSRLVLTDKAWAWLSSETNVELLKSNSAIGAIVLEKLLRQLVPFLLARGIGLSEIITKPAKMPQTSAATSSTQPSTAESQIMSACRDLNAQKPNGAIRLTQLRSRVPKVSRKTVDSELQRLHAAGRIALYRDDNSAAVTAEDDRAALSVGGEPRHLLYWKE